MFYSYVSLPKGNRFWQTPKLWMRKFLIIILLRLGVIMINPNFDHGKKIWSWSTRVVLVKNPPPMYFDHWPFGCLTMMGSWGTHLAYLSLTTIEYLWQHHPVQELWFSHCCLPEMFLPLTRCIYITYIYIYIYTYILYPNYIPKIFDA
jgi:hypothetical protein